MIKKNWPQGRGLTKSTLKTLIMNGNHGNQATLPGSQRVEHLSRARLGGVGGVVLAPMAQQVQVRNRQQKPTIREESHQYHHGHANS